MARLMKLLPFRELGIPVKILQGMLRNRGKRIPPWKARTVDNGSLVLIDGIPLVRVRGTPREIGRALGELTGEQARALTDGYMRVFAPDAKGDMPLARQMQVPEWHREELAGFAETAPLSADEMLLGQCFLDIHKVALCTTIAAQGASSTTGEIILGRNLDFPALALAHEAGMIVCFEPAGGRRHCGVTWPGFLGLLSGMNEDGLSLAMMLVYGHMHREHLNGQPFPLVFRRVLAECRDAAQAVELLDKRPYCTATNVMLADKSRDAVRAQLHPDRSIVARVDEKTPALACTNHFMEPGYKAFAFTWFSSAWRLARMNRAIRSGEKLDVARVKQLLQKTAMPGINLQRIIFLPERLEMEVALGLPTGGPRHWTNFSRQNLFPTAV
ncbi:MAG: hypothetical protein IT462_03475 [Planctomycetes bacterium]|nr:hypothetical protein [Planctomycetota bacterium]